MKKDMVLDRLLLVSVGLMAWGLGSYFKRFIESHKPEKLAIALALEGLTAFAYLLIRKRMKK